MRPPRNLKRRLPVRSRWTSTAITMLGKLRDRIVAKKLGVKVDAVRYKRTQLGIPPYYDYRWTKRWLKLLGTMPDTHIAKITGIHWKAVTRKRQQLKIPARWLVRHRWTAKELRMLGTMSDAELARRMVVVWSLFGKRPHNTTNDDKAVPAAGPLFSRSVLILTGAKISSGKPGAPGGPV